MGDGQGCRTGLGAGWLFPIIETIYFFLAFFSFTGENWIVADMPPRRKFGILLMLISDLTYVINSSAIRWIPAWWFPFLQIGVSTTLPPYLTRGMKQPGKSLAQMCIPALVILACMNKALRFGYMGVNESIGLILIFGLGSDRPYLWAGQKADGTWE